MWARTAALIGAGVSVWHLLVEQFPGLEGAVACDSANPCSLKWVDVFGFITIPYMSLSAFLLIAVLLSITLPTPNRGPVRPANPPTTGRLAPKECKPRECIHQHRWSHRRIRPSAL